MIKEMRNTITVVSITDFDNSNAGYLVAWVSPETFARRTHLIFQGETSHPMNVIWSKQT